MNMGPALYEMLTGQFADGQELDTLAPEQQFSHSVIDSIRRILNARAGSLKHLPDYGLPDLGHVYRHLPASAHQLMRCIEQTLLRYEPRLDAVEVAFQGDHEQMVLRYRLRCRLKQHGELMLDASFTPEGGVRLSHGSRS
ncbi:type VI secretion system baseplate subunit TssE [Chromobacterium haemolyticum]|uniref:Type VI secretion system baseplate subunit TssE n=2 Tax=Chromobacterium fluminis TaxID=3044269 RepID=A0ABX0LD40_9NEIS|nr:type VI secretion system baseplate subunit TssE [Chromobacterium haemolyticum]